MPDFVIYDESDALRTGPRSAVAQGDQYLYFLDKGSVTVSLVVETTSDAASKHRIGKVGPGAVLSLRSFMMSGGTPGSFSPLPTMAVADTECQLLRLRADKYASLEKADPALACKLIRLLSPKHAWLRPNRLQARPVLDAISSRRSPVRHRRQTSRMLPRSCPESMRFPIFNGLVRQ